MKTNRRKSIINQGLSTNRNLLAYIIIVLTALGIALVSYLYYVPSDPDTNEKIFSTLIPLFATWIGTILAFYFGRENFEAASNRYEEIINRLSPELLDDVLVSQIMITRKTMVSLDIAEAKQKTVKGLIDYLNLIDKSRLPILENNKPLYVIHKSTLLDAHSKQENGTEMSFEDFVKAYPMITGFEKVSEDAILEDVLAQIKDQPNVQDVFILAEDGTVAGWLTNTLIMRYIRA